MYGSGKASTMYTCMLYTNLGTKLVPDVAEAHTAALNVTGYLSSSITDEGLNFLLFDVLFSSHYMPIINVCTHQTRVTLPPSV